MIKLNLKGGTPSGWASLCDSCASSHIVKGFREAELVVICTDVHPNIPVPFKVQDCTSYEAMTESAIKLEPPRRSVGFSAATVEDEDLEDVTA